MRYFCTVMNPVLSSRSRRSSRRHRTRAQALVEFAVVLPVFLLLLAGILDFGFILYSRMTVISAAREGARVASTMTDQPQNIVSAVNGQVTSAAGGLSVTVPTPQCVRIGGGGCVFAKHTPPLPADVKAGDSIKVTVNYTHHAFFPLLFGASIPMSSTTQMVLE